MAEIFRTLIKILLGVKREKTTTKAINTHKVFDERKVNNFRKEFIFRPLLLYGMVDHQKIPAGYYSNQPEPKLSNMHGRKFLDQIDLLNTIN